MSSTTQITEGDCLDVMSGLDACSVDAIACDPPYGLGFMGREWDHGVPGEPFWAEALRVAKPGAHLVAFGGTRTYHRLACAIEDAGWEIRDCLQWMYGSGFPKSHNVAIQIDKGAGALEHRGVRVKHHVGQEHMAKPEAAPPYEPITDAAKQWDGWGTALKPSWEPIILARKPFPGTVAANVQEHGCGGLNVDGCRVGTSKRVPGGISQQKPSAPVYGTYGIETGDESGHDPNVGRWPANTILGCACENEHEPGCAVAMLDEQSGERSSGAMPSGTQRGSNTSPAYGEHTGMTTKHDIIGSTAGASRFFYTAKASRSEREAGLEHRPRRKVNDGRKTTNDSPRLRDATERANIHPTVKPVSLMRWLVRLITPPGGLVLDPFAGSGTTGVACVYEGFRFHGIELEAEHCEIARSRIAKAIEDAGKMTAEEAELRAEETGEHVQLGLGIGR